MKKIISSILIVCLVFSVLPLSSAADAGLENFTREKTYEEGQFADVSENAWYYQNVKDAFEFGLMIGSGVGRFNPNGHISIAEAVTAISRLHSIYYDDNYVFAATSPWYQAYVDYADINGFGYLLHTSSLGKDMSAPASRNTFALLLSIALPAEAFPEINSIENDSILDLWSFITMSHVYQMYRAGILSGSDSAHNFYSTSNIRRSEVAAIISRVAEEAQRIRFSLSLPSYPNKNNWRAAGCYKVGVDIPKGMYYVRPKNASTTFYSVFRYDLTGRRSPICSNSGISEYDFITVHHQEYFEVTDGEFILAENIPAISPKNGRYTNAKFRVGKDIPAGKTQIHITTEGKLGEYFIFTPSRANGQGGLLDTSTVIDFYIWRTGYREVELKEGQILLLRDSYIKS